MNVEKYLSALIQCLILIPAAASCYLPAKNQMKYTISKTIILCLAVLLPYSLVVSWLFAILNVDIHILLMPSLIPFFLLYRCTVKTDLPRSLAIYVGVCAIETFPAQLAYSFDAYLHPQSGISSFSIEAALFHLGLACLLLAAFVSPTLRHFSWAVDNLDIPKIWYSTVALSSGFLIFNVMALPHSYSTLYAGRLYYIHPMFEVCAMAVLVSIYVLFYHGAKIILEHAKLQQQSQLLEMQSYQYSTLLEHMHQTKRLRHDFRHSLRLLISLAEHGDIEHMRTHLKEYEIRFNENISQDYCNNAALNALLGYYHEMAVSAGIKTNWNIQFPESLTIPELDMASLLGNLIENAITGCTGVPKESRYFCLTTEVRHKNRLYVVSSNSFNGHTRKRKDKYLSTKHSGKGIGLTSINAIAEKYQGHARFSNNNKEFFVDVVLNI